MLVHVQPAGQGQVQGQASKPEVSPELVAGARARRVARTACLAVPCIVVQTISLVFCIVGLATDGWYGEFDAKAGLSQMRNFYVGATYVATSTFSSDTYVVTSLASGFKGKVYAATVLLSVAAVLIAASWVCSFCVITKRVNKKRTLRWIRALYLVAAIVFFLGLVIGAGATFTALEANCSYCSTFSFGRGIGFSAGLCIPGFILMLLSTLLLSCAIAVKKSFNPPAAVAPFPQAMQFVQAGGYPQFQQQFSAQPQYPGQVQGYPQPFPQQYSQQQFQQYPLQQQQQQQYQQQQQQQQQFPPQQQYAQQQPQGQFPASFPGQFPYSSQPQPFPSPVQGQAFAPAPASFSPTMQQQQPAMFPVAQTVQMYPIPAMEYGAAPVDVRLQPPVHNAAQKGGVAAF